MRENESPTEKQIVYYTSLVRKFIQMGDRVEWFVPVDLRSKIIISQRITAFQDLQNRFIIHRTHIEENKTTQSIKKARKLQLDQAYEASHEELERGEDSTPDEPEPIKHKYRTFA